MPKSCMWPENVSFLIVITTHDYFHKNMVQNVLYHIRLKFSLLEEHFWSWIFRVLCKQSQGWNTESFASTIHWRSLAICPVTIGRLQMRVSLTGISSCGVCFTKLVHTTLQVSGYSVFWSSPQPLWRQRDVKDSSKTHENGGFLHRTHGGCQSLPLGESKVFCLQEGSCRVSL